jgi:hypothetical protein
MIKEAPMTNQPDASTPQATQWPNGTTGDLQKEVEQLRAEKVLLESERDEYRKALYALLRSQLRPEDVVIPALTDCVPLRDVVRELDDLIGQN